jgi:hypothetical protein
MAMQEQRFFPGSKMLLRKNKSFFLAAKCCYGKTKVFSWQQNAATVQRLLL